MLGVLTIKLYLLSKPVTPIVAGAVASKAFDVLRCKDSAKNGKRKIEREEIKHTLNNPYKKSQANLLDSFFLFRLFSTALSR